MDVLIDIVTALYNFYFSLFVFIVMLMAADVCFLARDVIYTSRAYATMSLSVCLSVKEVHCGQGACREDGRGHLALC